MFLFLFFDFLCIDFILSTAKPPNTPNTHNNQSPNPTPDPTQQHPNSPTPNPSPEPTTQQPNTQRNHRTPEPTTHPTRLPTQHGTGKKRQAKQQHPKGGGGTTTQLNLTSVNQARLNFVCEHFLIKKIYSSLISFFIQKK